MFIDERNQLQFESIEEMAANKEYAIKEILNWEMPSVEELVIEAANTFDEAIESGLVNSVEDLIGSMSILMSGFAHGQEIIDSTLQNVEVSAKIREYFERCTMAYELIGDELRKN